MNALANLPRILLVDSNVYFAKRVWAKHCSSSGLKSCRARRLHMH